MGFKDNVNNKILGDREKESWRRLSQFLEKDINPKRFALGLTLFLVITLILAFDFLPIKFYGVEVGKPSPKTIYAPRSIEFIDNEKTKELQEEARAKVANVYRYDRSVETGVERNITDFFKQVKSVRNDPNLASGQQQIANLKEKTKVGIEQNVFEVALASPEAELSLLETKTLEAVSGLMKEKIKKSELEPKKNELHDLVQRFGLDATKNKFIVSLAASYLEPNYLYDSKLTEKLKQQAASKVKPYKVSKMEGETIVAKGEIVTKDEGKTLGQLGLLKSNLDLTKLTGVALLSLMVLLATGFYLFSYQKNIYRNSRLLLLFGIILLFILLLAKFVTIFSPYLIPVAAAAMLIAILFSSELAVVMVLILAALTTVVVGNNLGYFIVALLSGLLAIFLVGHVSRRTDLAPAGLWLSLSLAYLCFAVGLVTGPNLLDAIKAAGWGALSGFFSAVLATGVLPFIEAGFNITTDIKLLELADLNQALLHELMINAPGTYNHSVVAASLAESAAKEIGANPLLARVGAYYHDIGKMKRASFFAENQMGKKNPHDCTNPKLSHLIITSHVKEGVELARKHRLPEEVIAIINQHHGTSLVTYFFQRAKDKVAKQEIFEKDFRYPGELPTSNEAALVMLADSVEAAARTVQKPSPSRIEQLTRKIIQAKLEDGQLNKSKLSLTDLEKTTKVFAQILSSVYHTRMEYPEEKKVQLKKQNSPKADLKR